MGIFQGIGIRDHGNLVQCVLRDSILIPASQAFAFVPRNEAKIALILSKTPQIQIMGQVTSTDRSFMLPAGSFLHLYITNDSHRAKPNIYSETFLKSTSNDRYQFQMNIDPINSRL